MDTDPTTMLVWLTGAYALLTAGILIANWRAMNAMRAQNEALSRAYVVVRPVFKGDLYHLRVENIGRTAALGLNMRLDRPFFSADEESADLQQAYLFREKVATFAPGQRVNLLLGFGGPMFRPDADRERTPLQFHVELRYTTAAGAVVDETVTVDLEIFRALHTVKRQSANELHKIDETLKRIERVLGRFTPPARPDAAP